MTLPNQNKESVTGANLLVSILFVGWEFQPLHEDHLFLFVEMETRIWKFRVDNYCDGQISDIYIHLKRDLQIYIGKRT